MEHLRRLHSGGVGLHDQRREGRSESEEFLFHAEESTQRPGADISAEMGKEDKTLRRNSDCGPIFSGLIGVSDNCNANTHSFTSYFGDSYTNDTGRNGNTFFTGSQIFQVRPSAKSCLRAAPELLPKMISGRDFLCQLMASRFDR
jgi:hypothetical protein